MQHVQHPDLLCNIDINLQHTWPLKHLKQLKHTLATYDFSAMSLCCLDKWRLVAAKLDTSAEVDGGVELTSAAAARATRWRGSVTWSFSPLLLTEASVVEACRLGGGGCCSGGHDGRSRVGAEWGIFWILMCSREIGESSCTRAKKAGRSPGLIRRPNKRASTALPFVHVSPVPFQTLIIRIQPIQILIISIQCVLIIRIQWVMSDN
jgi:hypothetical protein